MTMRAAELERIKRVKKSMRELASLRLSRLERSLAEAEDALEQSRAAMDRGIDAPGQLLAGATRRLLAMAAIVEAARAARDTQIKSALREAAHEKALVRLAADASRLDAVKDERARLIDIVDRWSARATTSFE